MKLSPPDSGTHTPLRRSSQVHIFLSQIDLLRLSTVLRSQLMQFLIKDLPFFRHP